MMNPRDRLMVGLPHFTPEDKKLLRALACSQDMTMGEYVQEIVMQHLRAVSNHNHTTNDGSVSTDFPLNSVMFSLRNSGEPLRS